MEYLLTKKKIMKWMIVPFVLALAGTAIFALKDNELNEPPLDRYPIHDICIDSLIKQVDEEMYASLMYMKMAAHFGQNSVARRGVQKFFLENSKEEREHAQKLIDYINRRGGTYGNFRIKMPEKETWFSVLEALKDAVNLEKHVNNKLHLIHERAEKTCKDPHLMDFLEAEFLEEQIESINHLTRLITILDAMNNGMGEYLLDRQLLEEKSEL